MLHFDDRRLVVAQKNHKIPQVYFLYIFYFVCLPLLTLASDWQTRNPSSLSIPKTTTPPLDKHKHKHKLADGTSTSTTTMSGNPQQARAIDNGATVNKTKVCLIGSGNWGSAMATIIGPNCARLPFCHTQVNMWVYEENVVLADGTTDKLSNIINQRHENTKYLPGIPIPDNVVAIPDLITACRDANLLVFVLPHQFLLPLLPILCQHVHPTNCRAISLMKGLDFDKEQQRPVLISQTIAQAMRTVHNKHFQCGVLMGANVADQVARGEFCESTLACHFDRGSRSRSRGRSLDDETRQILQNDKSFRVQHVTDIAGTEVCGALKNVVALGAGFCDGMQRGGNTKAALMRIGLLEMIRFAQYFFDHVQAATFWESCGVADLITTCMGGRNRKCAEAFARKRQRSVHGEPYSISSRNESECTTLWESIETELLQGQKLQGTLTCKEVYKVLQSHQLAESFPLFCCIYEIAFLGRPVEEIVEAIRVPRSRL